MNALKDASVMTSDYTMRSRGINMNLGTDLNSSAADLKIVTNLTWPSFRNVALDVQKALRPYCRSEVLDWRSVKPGGNILFIETIRSDTLKFLRKFLLGSKVVFYGTTEGHSFLDRDSIKVAEEIRVVAVSNFVKQMLEEVNVPVAGVVHHGLDMDSTEVNSSFLQSVEEKSVGKLVTLTIAGNDPRKGLDKLLKACVSVEVRIPNSFLVLHSQPKIYYDIEEKRYKERHCDLPRLASELGVKNVWLTNSYGMLAPAEVNALYKLCSIYVFPSFSEGFGLPMLEAFRFNKPVVAVDAPPFNEVIEDGRSGKLIPCNGIQWYSYRKQINFKMHVYETSSLAETMSDLLLDTSLRKKMGGYIQENKHRWSIHSLYPKLLNYFNE